MTVILAGDLPTKETMQLHLTVKRGVNQVLRNVGMYTKNFSSNSFACQNLLMKEAQSVDIGDVQAIVINVNSGSVALHTETFDIDVTGLVVLEGLTGVTLTAKEDNTEVQVQYTIV